MEKKDAALVYIETAYLSAVDRINRGDHPDDAILDMYNMLDAWRRVQIDGVVSDK